MTIAKQCILAGLAILTWVAVAPAQTVWREGESPDRSTMNRHPWWYDQVKKDLLSGGDWISNFSEQNEGTAEYTIQIPKTARYSFWIRVNPIGAKLDYALDRKTWKPIDLTTDMMDTVNVAADGKPDLRFLAWKKADELELARVATRSDFGPTATTSITGRSMRSSSRTSPSCRKGPPGRDRMPALKRTRIPGRSSPNATHFDPMRSSISAR